MRRFLIVANQTLDSTLLADSVKGLIDAEESIFFVVAPATPLHDQVGYTAGPSPQGPRQCGRPAATQSLHRQHPRARR